MEKSVIAVAAFLTCAAVLRAEANVNITGPTDLGTYEPSETDKTLLFCAVCAEDDPSTWHTLSVDRDYTGYSFGIRQNTVFDFTGHTFTGPAPRIEGGQTVKLLKLLGGTWACPNGTWFRLAYWGGTRADNVKVSLDGVTMGLGSSGYWQGMSGNNNLTVLTNGTSFTAGCAQYFYGGENTEYTNNVLHISTGSQIILGSLSFDSRTVATHGAPYWAGNRYIVTGKGSFLGGEKTGGSASYNLADLGKNTSGNLLRVDDQAEFSSGTLVVGSGANTCSNRAEFASGATLYTRQGEKIGHAVGSDYNVLSFNNATNYHRTITDDTYVGEYGSFNKFIFEDSTYIGCHGVHVGVNAGASNNVAIIRGQKTRIPGEGFGYKMFGQGQHNEWIFDNCTIGTNVDLRVDVGTDANGSTNNTIKVVNGAILDSYDFTCHRSCASNTVFVGADSTFSSEQHDIFFLGLENRLVLSNGTVKLSASGYNLTFGKPDASETYPERGNRLVLQGSRPRIAMAYQDTSFSMHKAAVLEFDLPAEGYDNDHPIFDHTGFRVDWDTTIVFKDAEKLQKTLSDAGIGRKDYILSSGNQFSCPDLPSGKTMTDFFAERVTGLPKGCSLTIRSIEVSPGQFGERLVLHMKAPVGTAVVIR